MKITQSNLKAGDTLEIIFKSGDTYVVPAEAVTDLILDLSDAKKGERASVISAELRLGADGDVKAVGASRLTKRLFARLTAKCDVAGFDIISEDGSVYADVPCDPLVGLDGRLVECSNCASCSVRGKLLTLLLGEASKAPKRTDNDFASLLPNEPLKRVFGRIPTFENCRVLGVRTYTEKRVKKLALTLGVKEYGGRRLNYALKFSKVKDVNLSYVKTDETTALNVSTLAKGDYYVALPEFGLEFTCAKVEIGE